MGGLAMCWGAIPAQVSLGHGSLTFGELRAQRSRFAGTGSSTVQQAELEEAARLARIGYEAAFEGMEASAVVAGADRLRRTLKRARQRHGAEHDGRTSDG